MEERRSVERRALWTWPRSVDMATLRGRPRKAMEGLGRPWKATEGHGRARKAKKGHRRPQKAIEGHKRPQKAIEGHGRPYKATEGGAHRLALLVARELRELRVLEPACTRETGLRRVGLQKTRGRGFKNVEGRGRLWKAVGG